MDTNLQHLKKELLDSQPMLVSRSQLRDVITPMIEEVKQTIIDVMPIMPKRIDTEALTSDIAKAVEESVKVEHTTVENTTVQEVAVPEEVVQLLKLQSHAITLLKNQPQPPLAMDDYKPHDQTTVKGTKIAYYGFAAPDGSWYIMHSNGPQQRYSAGQGDYPSAWQDREKLKYSVLSEAMNE